MQVKQAISLRGKVRLPGDKSISHRAAMFASIASWTSVIENFSASRDCASSLDCMASLGVSIDRGDSTVTIIGSGKNGLKAPTTALDCGNSGTTMRLLSGILAGQTFESTLIGDDSLSRRPMQRIIGPLTDMGAEIDSSDGHAPLVIRGTGNLNPIEYSLPVASAQIKSCIVLAGLFADGETAVIEPVATRDHTERMLRGFGVDVRSLETAAGKRISVSGNSRLTGQNMVIPADVSAAAFFIAAAASLNGSHITMHNVGLNPTRTAFLDVVARLGANVVVSETRVSGGEPIGTVEVFGDRPLAGTSETRIIRGKTVANLIDEVPILAVLGTQIDGGIEIRDASELRVKESDRISTVVGNLRRMQAVVEEFDDGLKVSRSNLHGAKIDSHGDHRIAMAFAVAGLFADGETEIEGAESADVSFPGFFDMLEEVAFRQVP